VLQNTLSEYEFLEIEVCSTLLWLGRGEFGIESAGLSGAQRKREYYIKAESNIGQMPVRAEEFQRWVNAEYKDQGGDGP